MGRFKLERMWVGFLNFWNKLDQRMELYMDKVNKYRIKELRRIFMKETLISTGQTLSSKKTHSNKITTNFKWAFNPKNSKIIF